MYLLFFLVYPENLCVCQIIGTTCLFLAGKVEETPKKLKDVIEVTWAIRHKNEAIRNEEFSLLRESILTHELICLQTIAFDLTVEHPYKHVINNVKRIQGMYEMEIVGRNFVLIFLTGDKNLAQVAWNFVNDRLVLHRSLC